MSAMEEDRNRSHDDYFDLEAYIGSYTSHTKIDRLIFISEKSAGKPLELEALKIAADELKQGLRETFNTARYEDVMTRINGRLGPAYTIDPSLLDSAEKLAAARKERLESELHGSKSNLIKESIRLGHNDLGDFYYNRGSLQDAFKCYVRTRDYCTSPRHVLAMCLNVIRCAVEMGNFLHVANYVSKAEATPEATADPATSAKLKAALGLSLLDQRKYRQAARALVEVSPELGHTYSEVLSPADVALYGGLCALATFDRSELQSKVISSIGFREFLELHTQVRDLVHDFYNSRYASCLSHLAALKPALALDVHLHDHTQALYSMIRHRALVQYTGPYSSVSLAAMAGSFGTDTGSLEKELANLIVDGQVHARIDSQAKVLYARHADVRSATFKEVLSVGEAYARETRALLLRASLLQHDVVQRGGGRGGKGGGGGGGGFGGGGDDRGPRRGGRDRTNDREGRVGGGASAGPGGTLGALAQMGAHILADLTGDDGGGSSVSGGAGLAVAGGSSGAGE